MTTPARLEGEYGGPALVVTQADRDRLYWLGAVNTALADVARMVSPKKDDHGHTN